MCLPVMYKVQDLIPGTVGGGESGKITIGSLF